MLKTNKAPRPRISREVTIVQPVRIRIRVRKKRVKNQKVDRFLPKDEIKRDVRGMFSCLGVAVNW